MINHMCLLIWTIFLRWAMWPMDLFLYWLVMDILHFKIEKHMTICWKQLIVLSLPSLLSTIFSKSLFCVHRGLIPYKIHTIWKYIYIYIHITSLYIVSQSPGSKRLSSCDCAEKSRVQTTSLTFEGRYPYIPPVLFSPTEPKILEMLTMAALLQLSGSSRKFAAALRSNGISAWNTVTITMIDQFLLFYFVSSYHSQNKKRVTRSSNMSLNYLL